MKLKQYLSKINKQVEKKGFFRVKNLYRKKNGYLCGVAKRQTYFDESVIAFILGWKSGKFSTNQGKQSHSSLGIGIYCAGLSGPTFQYECGVLFI